MRRIGVTLSIIITAFMPVAVAAAPIAYAASCQSGYTYSRQDKACVKNSGNGNSGGSDGYGDGGVSVGSNAYSTNLPKAGAGSSELHQILQILFAVVGALAVLFVMIGALRYVLSDGDPSDGVRARETIIYALVGLVVAVIAETIVTYVLNKL